MQYLLKPSPSARVTAKFIRVQHEGQESLLRRDLCCSLGEDMLRILIVDVNKNHYRQGCCGLIQGHEEGDDSSYRTQEVGCFGIMDTILDFSGVKRERDELVTLLRIQVLQKHTFSNMV
ncbi:hypothetical protein E4U53_004455 [Claviceps sorghi]|nr:hypothetical protein E4U53_004455 [Claviceps sorghi]